MPPQSAMNLGETWASVRRQWTALGAGQRRVIGVAAGLALAGGLVAAVLGARGPALSPLFTHLTPADGAAIITQLGHDHVTYRLANNGRTILVPKAQVGRLRLQLAGQGLPKGGTVGLGSVLTLPFGATQFTRQVAYQSALQGELQQTIDQIHGVKASRVQIVLPQNSTFGGGGTAASASVLVQLQPGVTLTAAQVAGIAHLVASSVQGLTPAGVTVLDQTGQILWAQGGAGSVLGGGGSVGGIAGQAQSQLQIQQQFDQSLQTHLRHLLEQVFGPGSVVTQVQAQMSFNTGSVTTKLYSPKGSPAVVRSMQALKQSVKGGAATAGVPGTASNSFPTYTAGAGGGKTSSTSTQLTQDFALSQQDTHTILAPGTITRLSVAVVVGAKLTAAQLALVKSTVQAAVGAYPAQKNQVTVVAMPFNHTLLHGLAAAAPVPPASRLLVPALIGVGVLLLLLVLVLVLRRRAPGAVAVDDGVGATLASGVAVGVSAGAEDPLGSAIASAQAVRDRLHGALKQRPEDVARVIRVWLDQTE